MFAGNAYADATLNFVDPASGAFQSRIAVADGKLRVDAAGAAGGSYVVLDLKTRTLTQINPSARTTTSSSIAQVQAIISTVTRAADPHHHPLLHQPPDKLTNTQKP